MVQFTVINKVTALIVVILMTVSIITVGKMFMGVTMIDDQNFQYYIIAMLKRKENTNKSQQSSGDSRAE